MLVAALTNAMNNVADRYLNATPVPVVIFYHSVNGFVLISIFIVLEALITGNGFRFYTARQYFLIVVAVVIDSIVMLAGTMAF